MRGSEANAAAWVSAEEPAARVDGVDVDAEVDIVAYVSTTKGRICSCRLGRRKLVRVGSVNVRHDEVAAVAEDAVRFSGACGMLVWRVNSVPGRLLDKKISKASECSALTQSKKIIRIRLSIKLVSCIEYRIISYTSRYVQVTRTLTYGGNPTL